MSYRKLDPIPFNWPYMTGAERTYIDAAHKNGQLAGDGEFTKKCHALLESISGSKKALLTHSCTGSLEMTAMLLDLKPGDEVIMPSYTFPSTANAFVLRGAVPVFVDVRPDTLNIDEKFIRDAITSKTKAIVVVHYAGVPCEMDAINEIAKHSSLVVIEDAAQAIESSYKGVPAGGLGALATYSFHETKNVIAGEGGALLINEEGYVSRAEIIREKGTDRSRFFRGEVDKYSWVDLGSSYLPGELIAAFLLAQLERSEEITRKRMDCWNLYHQLLEPLELQGFIQRQIVPKGCVHNAHMYFVLMKDSHLRDTVLRVLKERGVHALFHYIPLHQSKAGKRYSRISGSLDVAERSAEAIIRLPLWVGLQQEQQLRVVEELSRAIIECSRISG